METHGPLIFGKHSTTDINVITDVWRRKLKKLWTLCGPWKEKPTPHRFRHTFARILLQRGVTDLVRVSDARMSGTAFGTVVLHVAPEAAVGGPLRAVCDGDPIVLDVDEQRLDLDLPPAEIARRLAELGPAEPKYRRGYGALYLQHVLQANEGCDFDFLRADGEPAEREPLGLLSGWVGGW